MKKNIFTLCALLFVFSVVKAQSVFTSVPVVNGKVVFQQFIHIDEGLSDDQRYALLYKWGKDNYAGNPLLSGIRFDEKGKSITVGSKVELILPENNAGVREKMLMNYRFDATLTNGGLMLVVRDITYQNTQKGGTAFFPKAYSAEEMIADSAINSSANASDKEIRTNLRKSTLYYLDNLYSDLSKVFELGR